ncbi:MAG: hypothetical protein PV344_03730 [Anaplasma sp.]|nr:hypothetical protein [Anaplasma sp.]
MSERQTTNAARWQRKRERVRDRQRTRQDGREKETTNAARWQREREKERERKRERETVQSGPNLRLCELPSPAVYYRDYQMALRGVYFPESPDH